MSLYKILELKPNADIKDIKKSYHFLAKKWHPDKCKNINAKEKFHEINYAYNILVDENSRKKYNLMNNIEQSNLKTFLEKIFKGNLKINELSNIGIKISKKEFNYLEHNFVELLNKLNLQEIIHFFTQGTFPKRDDNKKSINCSDSEKNIWDSDNAEYYYHLPIIYQNFNKNSIYINLNVSLDEIITNKKKKIKIKRNINNTSITTNYIFTLNKPNIVYIGGGDCSDISYGNLIIKLSLPKQFDWNQNIIVYNHYINLYQMIYGTNIKLQLGNKLISINQWVPIRDGYIIPIENINLINYYLKIKLNLNYSHTNEKENILKLYFS